MYTLTQLQSRREQILALARKRGASHVRVFGSVARGEAGNASDVDFLVEFEPCHSLLDQGGLLADLQDLLGCQVDILSERALRPRFKERIMREALPL